MTLNAMKRRLLEREQRATRRTGSSDSKTRRRARFRRINGAAAILDDAVFAETDLTATDASAYPESRDCLG